LPTVSSMTPMTLAPTGLTGPAFLIIIMLESRFNLVHARIRSITIDSPWRLLAREAVPVPGRPAVRPALCGHHHGEVANAPLRQWFAFAKLLFGNLPAMVTHGRTGTCRRAEAPGSLDVRLSRKVPETMT
jgi:hypothetical protein